MKRYYELRAPEYDDWYEGSGLYASRPRPGLPEEVPALRATVAALAPASTLDVACGTGYLSRDLRGQLTLLDQSAAMLEIAAARVPSARAVQSDAQPLPFEDGSFERVFTGHFYGHLQEDERGAFLHEARRVAGELVVADSARRAEVASEEWQERLLSDGSRHQVYKRYFTGAGLAEELGGGEVLFEGEYFVVVRAG